VDDPWRLLGLRSFHVAPFVDGGWVWDRQEAITEVEMRSSAGLRLIAGFAFASIQRFEVAVDVAHPLDALGRREDEGWQVWIRLQSTAGGGTH
jgi:hemolysin activation/secretion protein